MHTSSVIFYFQLVLSQVLDQEEYHFRIDRTFGTLFHILSKGGKLILCTHVGRPRNKKSGKINTDSKYDVKPIVDYLRNKLYTEFVVPDFKEDQNEGGFIGIDTSINLMIKKLKAGTIDGIYLPNVRWFQGEESGGIDSEKFAEQLAGLADVYVNDAFGSWQPHTSTMRVCDHLPSYAGYLMQHEIRNIEQIFSPEPPMLAIIAGSKFDTKIGPLHSLLKKVDKLIMGGVILNAFLSVKYEVNIKGISRADLKIARDFLAISKEFSDKIVEPKYITESDTLDGRVEGKYRKICIADLKPGQDLNYILDVAPESFDEPEMIKVIMNARSIFVNAVMGYTPHFFKGTQKMYSLIGENIEANKMFGGGDTLQEFRSLLPGQYISAVDDPNYYFFSGGGTILKAIHEGTVKGLAPVKALIRNKREFEDK